MPEEFIPFARPDITDRELEAVTECVRSGWLTTGPRVAALEERFAARVGAAHAVAMNSCTAALHVALAALEVGAGDDVVTTPYTFAATAAVIEHVGATPVFADINALTFNLDPHELKAKLSSKTKAVIVVHFGGLAADIDEIAALCVSRGIRIIHDAAHSFPATYKGRVLGSIGDVTCFSFYATKTMTCGEGGMLCTSSQEVAERCRILTLHGLSRDAHSRYSAGGRWYYEILYPGFKYNMPDISASLALVQLSRVEEMRSKREWISDQYDRAFSSYEELIVPFRPAHDLHSWHLYPLRIDLERLDIDRAEFIRHLTKLGIGTSVHFIPLHIHPYYRERYRYRPQDFPCAHQQYLREISLPIYSKMEAGDVDRVIEAVTKVVRQHRA